MLLVVVPIGLLTVLYSTSYLTEGNREHPVGSGQYGRYYFWLLLFIASMVGVAISPNFLQLLVFWELTTVCSWALISFHQDERSLRAGFKAMLMTQVGGAFLLVVTLIVFARTGSFEFSALAHAAGWLAKLGFRVHSDCGVGEGGAGSPCTRGCRMPWRLRLPSAPTCTPRRWSKPAST